MMLCAAAAGALLAGIPLTGIFLHGKQDMGRLQEKLAHYEKLQEQYSYLSVFVLTRDVTAGEELTAESFKERRVQSVEDLSLAQPCVADDFLGKRVKVSLAKGAALGRDLVYEGGMVADDERQVELTGLYLPETLQEDEFIDVRIVFPDGEDYLVVKRKRVYRLIRDEEGGVLAVGLRLLEEELLRYQAAVVDTRTYEDTRLYALQYTGDFQAAGSVYYPVSQEVFGLLQWDPNIAELFLVDAEQERRRILESHLERFRTGDLQKADGSSQDTDFGTGGTEPPQDTDFSTEPSQETGLAADGAPDDAQTKEPLTLYTGLPEEP